MDIKGFVPDVEITSLCSDTRQITAGSVFFCLKGSARDGHDFAAQALERGAAAVVVERDMGLGDKQLITDAASKGNLSEEVIRRTDETAANSLLYTLAMGSNVVGTTMHFGYKMPINDKLFSVQSDIIRKTAENESAVFIGRCADYVLNEDYPVFRVFIFAPLEKRINARVFAGLPHTPHWC